jgi:hypothetical protein
VDPHRDPLQRGDINTDTMDAGNSGEMQRTRHTARRGGRRGRGRGRGRDRGADTRAGSSDVHIPPVQETYQCPPRPPFNGKSQEYSKVRSILSASPFASLTGQGLVDFMRGLLVLSLTEPEPGLLEGPPSRRKRVWRQWWQTLQCRFALDIGKVQDFSAQATISRLAAFVTVVTHVKPSNILSIIEAATTSFDSSCLHEFQCVW